jgi:putative transposase
VIQRGNNRGPCFVDDQDREHYLAALLHASQRARCAIHAYVLMSNHTHLLVTAADAFAPARMMQSLGRKYVRYFNERHGRTGTLWEGRFRSGLIDSERYLLQCSRYIELNPVRAGMVADPASYRWSSFRSNAAGETDMLVRRHAVYLALGQSPASRRDAYRALFDTPLEWTLLDAIRRTANRGVVLGVDERSSSPAPKLDRQTPRVTRTRSTEPTPA